MPPSLRDWVAEDHLAWTVLEAVGEMDLSEFYAVYRPDGQGRPAYEPAMMVALLMYAYSQGNRSSRGIERKCREDVAYRVIAVNLVPDHSTIEEFRARHEAALAGLFSEVLSLCRAAGMVNVGVIAVVGTKVHANASNMANRDYRQIALEILKEADRIDREEESCMALSAAMSCPSTCGPARVVALRCGTPSANSTRTARSSRTGARRPRRVTGRKLPA